MPSGERSLGTEDPRAPDASSQSVPGGAPSRYNRADQFSKSLLRDARLLGAGALFREAVDDLSALPDGAWEQSTAKPLLLHFGLASAATLDNELENDMPNEIKAIMESWEQKGRREEAARAVLTALRVRGIAVPDADRERILAEKDPGLLQRWLEKAILATSVAEVLSVPS